MTLKEEITKKTKEINDSQFVVQETYSIPTISNSKLTFGCTGLVFDATVLYIDMRGSTIVLNKYNKRTVAKIHMIYYHAIVKIAKETNGEIRSFNGDSLLVFYYGKSEESISNAVKAAMQMRYAITHIINETLKNYMDIDFGIGIDCGRVLATKVGVGGSDETKDLIWIGNAVNRAAKIGDLCKYPHYIGISESVYGKLTDDVKYGYNEYKQWVNMWTQKLIKYNDNNEAFYATTWYWTL